MKLKEITTFKSKLFRLQLLKFKTYVINENQLRFVNLKSIELHLKHVLKIIYKYHINNKKIMVIGIPQLIQRNFQHILQKTQHLFLAENIWVKGIFSNKVSTFKYIQKQFNLNVKLKKPNTNLNSLFKIQKKPDLIIIFNKKSDSDVLQEAKKQQLPIIGITLNSDCRILYKIPGNFQFLNKKINNLLFILLYSLFKI